MSRYPQDRRIEMIHNPPVYEPEGAVPFMATWSLCVPVRSGVYVVSDLRGPLYVGRTTDLRRRFEEHLKGSHNRLLARAIDTPVGTMQFQWITVEGKQTVILEAYLISNLMPVCNVMLNRPKRHRQDRRPNEAEGPAAQPRNGRHITGHFGAHRNETNQIGTASQCHTI